MKVTIVDDGELARLLYRLARQGKLTIEPKPER